MDFLELIKQRRSIRKYQDRQVEAEALEKILTAGLYAPCAGGLQSTRIIALQDAQTAARLGRLNVLAMDLSKLAGFHVSQEQPSIIDDPAIKSGFYGAPTVCIVLAPQGYPYSVADAFCSAENMVLEATALGVSSCIIARAEDTFATEYGAALLQEWQVPAGYLPRCFVLLGYCQGAYPGEKPRKEGRYRIVE